MFDLTFEKQICLNQMNKNLATSLYWEGCWFITIGLPSANYKKQFANYRDDQLILGNNKQF